MGTKCSLRGYAGKIMVDPNHEEVEIIAGKHLLGSLFHFLGRISPNGTSSLLIEYKGNGDDSSNCT